MDEADGAAPGEREAVHRAFDTTRDTFEAIETRIAPGVARVQASGQEETVLPGVPRLAELVWRAGERTVVMPGGLVTEEEIGVVARETGAKKLHFACFDEVESPTRFRIPRVFMGASLPISEHPRGIVRADRVRRFAEGARGSAPRR